MKSNTIIRYITSQVTIAKIITLFVIIVGSLTVSYLHAAWTAPDATFPNSNVDIPINIGQETQNKAGLLGASSMVTLDFQVGSDAAPDTPGVLVADINGNIGAAQYCDQDGNNCTLATDLGSGIPSQTGNDGKYLFTNGTNLSWRDVGGITGTVYACPVFQSNTCPTQCVGQLSRNSTCRYQSLDAEFACTVFGTKNCTVQ